MRINEHPKLLLLDDDVDFETPIFGQIFQAYHIRNILSVKKIVEVSILSMYVCIMKIWSSLV